jgi:multidrug transporter EmrE-like cation transporter
MDSATIALILILMGLAFVHIVGEILFKKGGMVSFAGSERGLDKRSWKHFLFSPIVILSLFITLAVKVLYGITLASNPLYLAGGVYLATVAVFSVLAGRIVFDEELRKIQIIGFVLISLGIILLV